MRRLRPATALLLLLAACGAGEPIPEEDLLLRVSVDAGEIALAKAFPLTVVRVWSRDLVPGELPDSALSPLAVRLLGIERREDGRRVMETRRYLAFALSAGVVTVPSPSFTARPAAGGPERTVRAERLVLRVARALPPGPPGPAEPPPGPLSPRRPWLAPAAALAAAVVLVAALLAVRARRRPAAATAPADAGPPPESPRERALRRLAALRARPADGREATEACFAEASALLRDFLHERFGLPTRAMTSTECVAGAGDRAGLPPSVRESLSAALATCDLVKFASREPPPPERDAALTAAGEFLEAAEPAEGGAA